MFDYAPQQDKSPGSPTNYRRWRLYKVVLVPILKEKLKRFVFILLIRSSVHLHSRPGIEKNKKALAVCSIHELFVFFASAEEDSLFHRTGESTRGQCGQATGNCEITGSPHFRVTLWHAEIIYHDVGSGPCRSCGNLVARPMERSPATVIRELYWVSKRGFGPGTLRLETDLQGQTTWPMYALRSSSRLSCMKIYLISGSHSHTVMRHSKRGGFDPLVLSTCINAVEFCCLQPISGLWQITCGPCEFAHCCGVLPNDKADVGGVVGPPG